MSKICKMTNKSYKMLSFVSNIYKYIIVNKHLTDGTITLHLKSCGIVHNISK